MSSLVRCVLLTIGLSAGLCAAEIELIADFNIKGGGIDAGASCGGWFYFAYNDGVHGIELWRSDGTSEGTALFCDLVPGGGSSSPRAFATVDGALWFAADTGDGHEPWTSDGTTAGTYQVVDVDPAGSSDPSDFGPAADGVIFYATTPDEGREPWFSDGSTATLVADINTGAASSVAATTFDPRHWGQLGDTRIFAAEHPSKGVELFASDGSDATLIADINSWGGFTPGRFFGEDFVQVGDLCFFTGGYTLRATDGSAIWEVGDLTARDLVAMGGALYCVVDNTSLYRVSADGEERVEILEDPNSILYPAAVGDRLYFRATPPGGSGGELWISDGTAGGTQMLVDLRADGSSEPRYFTALSGGGCVFLAKVEEGGSSAEGFQLYYSDGTAAGTQIIDAIDPGGLGADVNGCAPLGVAGDAAFFAVAYPGVEGALLATAGSSASSVVLCEPRYGPSSSGPFALAAMNGEVFAIADPNRSNNLDATDSHLVRSSTAGVTSVLGDLHPGTGQVVNGHSCVIDGYLWISSYNNGGALWVSDGTAAGTRQVDGDTAQAFRDLGGGHGVFIRDDALWAIAGSGGDPAASVSAVDGPGNPEDLLALGDTLYFTATDGAGRELWRYSAAGGAERLTDIDSSGDSIAADSWPSSWHRFKGSRIVAFDGALYFPASDGDGTQLWRCAYDGSDPTRITGIGSDADVAEVTVCAGRLYFAATGPHGRELWTSDGSVGSQSQVADIAAGDSDPTWLTAVGDTLFFTADDGSNGRELWCGDASGVELLGNLSANAKAPENLVAVGGSCVFTLEQPATGAELYVSDGTSAGTGMVADLNPGIYGGEPFKGDLYNHVIIGQTIYFPATQPAVGCELFAYTPESDDPTRSIRITADPAPEGLEAECDGAVLEVPARFEGMDPGEDVLIWLLLPGGGPG